MSRLRLLYLVSHPIQYQAPLLRLLAAEDWLDLTVRFERIPDQDGSYDPGFRRVVAWDVPLLDGYDNRVLTRQDLPALMAQTDMVWLHGWQSATMKRALRYAHSQGKPVLMRSENWDRAMPDGPGLRGWLKRLYLGWIFRRCSAFLAIGSANSAYYRAHGVAEQRIFPVPYAVDNGFFADQADAARPQRAEILSGLGLDPARPVILFSGKLMARKRPDLLAAAWRRAWPHDDGPQLLFVGEGEMEAQLRHAAPGAVFAGFRNQRELPALYAAAEVFVLPSECEPWGLAVNEAMACGTAVVVSDQVGAAFDLVDESCGAIFPAGDEAALAAALERVIAQAATRGQAARARMAHWDFAADIRGLRQATEYCAENRP